MADEVAALNRIRLDDDLTLLELAGQVGVDASTLSRLFDNPDRQPFERTLHKVRRFLERRAAAEAAAAKTARRRKVS